MQPERSSPRVFLFVLAATEVAPPFSSSLPPARHSDAALHPPACVKMPFVNVPDLLLH